MDKNWDNCLQTLEGHSRHGVMSVALSPDNQLIASGGRNRTVKIWDIIIGIYRYTLEGHDDKIHSITFLPDNSKCLMLVLVFNGIKIWDAVIGSSLLVLEISAYFGIIIARLADSKYLALGETKSVIKLFDIETGIIMQTLKGFRGLVISMAFMANSYLQVILGLINITIKIWDIEIRRYL
ncbi:WD40-repeat-containing domain protein [Fusarium oxysporum]|nr:WD40-repeat-containing domain protein [Fusarium oxysporum]